MNKLLTLKDNKIVHILLKNNCTIYGEYIRDVIISNIDEEEYFSKNTAMQVCASRIDRVNIERDIYEYKVDRTLSLGLITDRYRLIKYYIEYKKMIIELKMLYININNNQPLPLLDIDLIQLSRDGLKLMTTPSMYYFAPTPFLYILDKIKNNVFNIITEYEVYDINDFKYCRTLEENGWRNEIAKYKFIDYLTNIEDNCSICRTKFDIKRCIKLECNHYYHLECWDKHVIHELTTNVVLANLKCPLCRREYGIKNII